MSKGQQRSNREPKKPKQIKPKIVASDTASKPVQTKLEMFPRGKKRM